MRYRYLPIEKYIADKITSLCEKRDISKYRLSQFFQEGNSENLTEKQKEILRIWNALGTNEQETVMSMHVDFRSRRTVRVYVSAVLFYF